MKNIYFVPSINDSYLGINESTINGRDILLLKVFEKRINNNFSTTTRLFDLYLYETLNIKNKLKVGDWFITRTYNEENEITYLIEKCNSISETGWINRGTNTRHISSCMKILGTSNFNLIQEGVKELRFGKGSYQITLTDNFLDKSTISVYEETNSEIFINL